MAARPSWCILLPQETDRAASLPRLSAGSNMAASREIIAMTMSSSTRVKAGRRRIAFPTREHRISPGIMEVLLKADLSALYLPARNQENPQSIQHVCYSCKGEILLKPLWPRNRPRKE